jgi:hypothetical protein
MVARLDAAACNEDGSQTKNNDIVSIRRGLHDHVKVLGSI